MQRRKEDAWRASPYSECGCCSCVTQLVEDDVLARCKQIEMNRKQRALSKFNLGLDIHAGLVDCNYP